MPGIVKTYRTELVKHLYHMHGKFTISSEQPLEVEILEGIHEDMHLDKYACPPHKHETTEEAFELGEIKLKYGPDYLQEIVKRNAK
jgi:hypothetical protein